VNPPAPGNLYAAENESRRFALFKVLAVTPGTVHIRTYKRTLKSCPKRMPRRRGDVAIGHIPISNELFEAFEPVLLATEAVDESELEGFLIWRDDANAGAFGPSDI
jgi:hypothetical protein